MSRPALPHTLANSRLPFDGGVLPPVKYQILTCQGQDILVGRMKIPTPTGSGHAFILRRFDTGAISLTTMFRAAFPEASETDEKRETSWVKENFDVAKNNGSSKDQSIVRLAGVWVSPEDALAIADTYSLSSVVKAMAAASPDPSANYRRSGKANAHPSPPSSKKLPSPPMTDSPNPAKRRKEATPPSSKAQSTSLSVPRRSARTKSSSPAPPNPTPASPPRRTAKMPKGAKSVRVELPKLLEEAKHGPDEDAETAARLGEDMLKEDVAEQKALIANLKAEREAAMEASSVVQSKRGRAEAEQEMPTQLNIQEPESEERAIATNARVSRFRLAPTQKSFAWGVAAFAVGLGAVSLLPNFT